MKFTLTLSLSLLVLVAGQPWKEVVSTDGEPLSVDRILQTTDKDWFFSNALLDQLLSPYMAYQSQIEACLSASDSQSTTINLVPFSPETSPGNFQSNPTVELLTDPKIIHLTVENLDRLCFNVYHRTQPEASLNLYGFRRLIGDLMKVAIAKDDLELVKSLLNRDDIRAGDDRLNNHWKLLLNHPAWQFWAENLGSSKVSQYLTELAQDPKEAQSMAKVTRACHYLNNLKKVDFKCPQPGKEIQWQRSSIDSEEEANNWLHLDKLRGDLFKDNLLVACTGPDCPVQIAVHCPKRCSPQQSPPRKVQSIGYNHKALL
ncbi:hypothetical protein IWQ61_004995 [Dispira simplex]|nr:hypothetical protein IWQ61_004995 [Dispira simplex]